MKAFLSFGYGDIEKQWRAYHPVVQAQVLEQIPRAGKVSYYTEVWLFIVVWLLRLYWFLMVAWFFYRETSLQVQILSIPLFLCSLAIVYSLGVVVRSSSVLHIFFAVVGILTAGVVM